MGTRVVSAAILLLLFSSTGAASAQSGSTPESAAPADPATGVAPATARPPEDEERGDSERARSGKIAGVGLAIGGGAVPIITSGFDGFWVPSESWQLGLRVLSGTLDLTDAVPKTDGAELKKATFGVSFVQVQGRWFPGNSFNLGLGLGQRTVKAEFDIESKLARVGVEGEIKATTTVLNITIGNQWMWDSGFFLGVDWLGYAMPLGSSTSGKLEQTGSAPATDDLSKLQKDSEDLAKTLGETGTVSLFMLQLGFAF